VRSSGWLGLAFHQNDSAPEQSREPPHGCQPKKRLYSRLNRVDANLRRPPCPGVFKTPTKELRDSSSLEGWRICLSHLSSLRTQLLVLAAMQ